MSKFVYWVGIYAICTFTHDTIHEAVDYLVEEHRRKRKVAEEKKNCSVNLTTKTTGGPIDRIGF